MSEHEHPSLTPILKNKPNIYEQLENEIEELRSQNSDSKQRLETLVQIKEQFDELKKEQSELRLREDQELDDLEKKALQLLIKRLGS